MNEPARFRGETVIGGGDAQSYERQVEQLGERLRSVNREVHRLTLQRRWLLKRIDVLEERIERVYRARRTELERI